MGRQAARRGKRAGTRAQGRGKEEGEGDSERGERGTQLGIQKPAITVTGSPRARKWRERWKKERGSCCAGKSNEREIEGREGRAGPGRAGSGWAGSRAGMQAHNTHDH
jgi:hypothetical protein